MINDINRHQINDTLRQLNYPIILIKTHNLIIDRINGNIDWNKRPIIQHDDKCYYLPPYNTATQIEIILEHDVEISNYIYQKEIQLIKKSFEFNSGWKSQHDKLTFLWYHRNEPTKYKSVRKIYFL